MPARRPSRLGLVGWIASLVGTTVAAQAAPVRATEVRLVAVARGVHAFIAPAAGIVSGNTVLIIGDSGAVVVDAGHFPATAQRVIGEIRRLSTVPVRYLINTHWHPDHWTANATYADSFPGLVILSTPETKREIERIGPAYLRLYRDSSAVMAAARGPLDTGKNPDGSALSEDQRRYSSAVLADTPDAIAAWKNVRLVPPRVTFERSLDLDLGSRRVQVRFLGRGNTAGDAVVYLPDTRTLVAGDLLVHPTPYAYGSYFADWVQVLDSLMNLGAETIVPGHGEVQRDARYLSQVRELLDSVRTQVTRSVRRGHSLEETRKALALDRLERLFVGDDALRRARFHLDFLAPGVARAFEEARYLLGQ